jgi:hypothetical protein
MVMKKKRKDTCSNGCAAAMTAQVAGFDSIIGDAAASGGSDDDHFMRDMQSNRKDEMKWTLAVLQTGVAGIAS